MKLKQEQALVFVLVCSPVLFVSKLWRSRCQQSTCCFSFLVLVLVLVWNCHRPLNVEVYVGWLVDVLLLHVRGGLCFGWFDTLQKVRYNVIIVVR